METTLTKRKHFTQEKKRLIVKEHLSTGIPIPVLARKYGIHAITLYGWKRSMNNKKEPSEIDPETIKKLVEENDRLRADNKNLMAKVGDLSIRNDILKEGLDFAQKKAILKALESPKKSKKIIGMR
ncbi:MAG: transposase [Myxococcaceae bacterium]